MKVGTRVKFIGIDPTMPMDDPAMAPYLQSQVGKLGTVESCWEVDGGCFHVKLDDGGEIDVYPSEVEEVK